MNEYLNVLELHQLTGLARPGKQSEWLKQHSIPHRADGTRLIVSRVHVQRSMGPCARLSYTMPDYGIKQAKAPSVWTDDHIIQPDSLLIQGSKVHPTLGDAYAIYALFDIDDELLYVGQTCNLINRIRSHYSNQKCGFVYYSAIGVPADLLNAVELAHIYALEPPGNVRYGRIDNLLHGSMVEKIRKAWGI